ncbi:MAG TPA: hypothetical protein VNP93_10995 [Gaiellaceae bacterium]|nr:hypothetical protein [Gaiellaceae bacterium]
MLAVLAASALSALAAAPPADRPPPPPDWSAQVRAAALERGAQAVFTYRASSADAFDLRVTLRPLPRGLRFVRAASSPFRLVGGRPTWAREFPGRQTIVRSVRIAVRVEPGASPGTRLCLTLRQVASNGGAPDVVPLRACSSVL